MVYPVIVVFPLSLGSVHSRATLKPQVSTILMLAGGPGNSGEQVNKSIKKKKKLKNECTVNRSPRCVRTLTNNLQSQLCFVLKAVHFHTYLIHAGVGSLDGTDEDDAVLVAVADVHLFSIQRLAILCP